MFKMKSRLQNSLYTTRGRRKLAELYQYGSKLSQSTKSSDDTKFFFSMLFSAFSKFSKIKTVGNDCPFSMCQAPC